MQVEIRLIEDMAEPRVVIYAREMTAEITQAAAAVQSVTGRVVTVWDQGRILVLRPEDIYMVRAESEKTLICAKEHTYSCAKRLYEAEELLGGAFMRISRSALINLKYLDYVEPSFNGLMRVILKNGAEDYVSRKYLPALKRYLNV